MVECSPELISFEQMSFVRKLQHYDTFIGCFFISGMGPLDRGAAQRHRLPNGFRMNLLLEEPDPEPRINWLYL